MPLTIETPNVVTLENLLKLKYQSVKLFAEKAQELAKVAVKERKIYIVYRLARELQELGYDVGELEDCITSCSQSFFIFRFAKEIKTANIKKLQDAIIKTCDLDYIAKFGCFINGADYEHIQNFIISKGNARAAYIYLTFGKHPDIARLRPIFLKSKKPRYIYALARLSTDPVEIEQLQELVINSNSNMYVRLFATNIPGADIRKLEDRVLQTKDFAEIKKFARSVQSDRLNKLIMLI